MLGYREISTEGLVGKMRFKMAASSQLHKKRIVKFVASNYDFEADFFHGNRFFFKVLLYYFVSAYVRLIWF